MDENNFRQLIKLAIESRPIDYHQITRILMNIIRSMFGEEKN